VFARLFSKKDTGSDRAPVGPPPSSALTRWLRQGVQMWICPLCRVEHKADREFIWHFSEEGALDDEQVAQLTRARGFCAEHAGMLELIDRQAGSMLGMSTVYGDLFEGIVADLDGLDPGDRLETATCPACVNREGAVDRNAGYLLSLLTDGTGFADRFGRSPGLCFRHFGLVWDTGGPADARSLLLDVQRRSSARLAADLQEFIGKQGVEVDAEPTGAEQEAWRRAVCATAGWPAPAGPASVPEHQLGR